MAPAAAQQLGIFKTAPGASTGRIAGDDMNPIQPRGLFTTLTLLRDSLMKNDTAGINRAAALLDADGQRVIHHPTAWWERGDRTSRRGRTI